MQQHRLRQLAANFSYLIAGESVSKLFTFAAFAFLARIFGPERFGHLEFVLAGMMFATLFADFGANPLGSREVAKDPQRLGQVVANLVVMRAILAVVSFLLLLLFGFAALGGHPDVRYLLILYGLSLAGIPLTLQWVFQGLEKMAWVALASIVRQMAFAIGVFTFVWMIGELWAVAVVEWFAMACLVAFCLIVLSTKIQTGDYHPTRAGVRRTFREALPIGLSDLTWAFMWYFATVLLGLLVGGKSVGWFSAAHRPVLTLHTFVWLYFCNLLPTISRCSREPHQVLFELMRHSMSLVSWGTVFIGVTGLTMAEPVLVLVYGADYRNAAAVMQILIWMIPVSFLGSHYRYILIGFGKQTYELYAHVASAVVSVGLAFVLVPVLFEQGAAISLLAAVSVYATITYIFTRRQVQHIPFAKHFVKPLFTGGATVLVFLSLRSTNVWAAGLVSSALYMTVMAVWEPQVGRLWTHVVASRGRDDAA